MPTTSRPPGSGRASSASARSRRSLLQEELGYIEGGSETLVDALVARDRRAPAATFVSAQPGRRRSKSRTAGSPVSPRDRRIYPADAVISTVPTPLISPLVPDLPTTEAPLRRIRNIGVVCVVLQAQALGHAAFLGQHRRPSVRDSRHHRVFQPAGGRRNRCLIPYYMPVTNPLWGRTDEAFVDEACLHRASKSAISRRGSARVPCRAAQARAAGLSARLRGSHPAGADAVAGLQIADTCFYYPEDRRDRGKRAPRPRHGPRDPGSAGSA